MDQKLLAVMTLAITLFRAWACPPEAATIDYESKLCEATVVFRGLPTSGKSALAMTKNNKQMTSTSWDLDVHQYFKDTTGRRADTITIAYSYTEGDLCQVYLFSEAADSYLIFATGGNHLSLSSCTTSIPWECVPANARTVLQNPSC